MRARLGLLIASANSTIEYEFQTLSNSDTSIHSTRLPHRKLSDETAKQMRDDAVSAADLLAHGQVDCIVYGVTAPSFLLGTDHDFDLTAEIESATGIKAVTVMQAVLGTLSGMGVERLALGTPYTDEVTDREKQFLSVNGYTVTGSAGLGFSDVAQIGDLEPCSATDVAKRAVTEDAQALFLSCTNWHTLPVLEELEARLSIPVFSSNRAAFELAIQKAHP